jgi:hypothetical protein
MLGRRGRGFVSTPTQRLHQVAEITELFLRWWLPTIRRGTSLPLRELLGR